jgi:hypothetical protein
MFINAFIYSHPTTNGMAQYSEPKSLQVVVAREAARNYRSFIHRGRKHRNEQSNLEKIYSEEVEVTRRHPHPADKTGFS